MTLRGAVVAGVTAAAGLVVVGACSTPSANKAAGGIPTGAHGRLQQTRVGG
jgi:hypothetical protein